jgi:prephenate dehydrogenase
VRVAIAGLGLIGGSAGLAWRAAGHTVLGYARRPETRRLARERGAVDEATDTLAGLAGAEVVVLAPPVLAVRDLLAALVPWLTPGTVVTDVASTKRCVERWAADLLPPGVAFVGGHPMAGKETAGLEHAAGDLFRDRTWCVVPPAGAPGEAVRTVTRLALDAGARPLLLDAVEHDRAVAATSHLTFMVAAALCETVVAGEHFREQAAVAGSGLRDTTRLASGDPLMHRDICLTNRDFLVQALEAYAARIGAVTALLRRLPEPEAYPGAGAAPARAVADLERYFDDLKVARDEWLSRPPPDGPA